MVGDRHPDHRLLAQTHAALQWWQEQPHGRPTSSLAGTGMINAAELALRDALGEQMHVLALPSATAGLQVALQALGVTAGDDVLVPALDWTAASAAVRSLGAQAVPVPISTATLTVDPDQARRLLTRNTKALIATHLLGVAADVPLLRQNLPVPVVEDAAQALGAQLDHIPVGTLGDLGVFSGKGLASDGYDVAEIGFLVTSDPELHRRAISISQHPLRQLLSGLRDPDPQPLCRRAAPLSALLAAYGLSNWKTRAASWSAAQPAVPRHTTCLLDHRRQGRPGELPLLLGAVAVPPELPGTVWQAGGLAPHPALPAGDHNEVLALARRAGVLRPTSAPSQGSRHETGGEP